MLLELTVLAGCFFWGLLCLLGNAIQNALHLFKNLFLGLLSWIRLLVVAVLRLIKGLALGVWFLVRGLFVGLHRVLVLLTWTAPRFVLTMALAVVCHVSSRLWQGVRGTLPYSVLFGVGFMAVHLLLLACRSQSLSAVLRTLNLTPPSRTCPF